MDILNTAFNIMMAARNLEYQGFLDMTEKERSELVDALATLEDSKDPNLKTLYNALRVIFDR